MKEPIGPITVKTGHGVAWGLGGGIIASLCCLGPLVAVALGLGSASFLLGLTAYRPYFLAASVLFMGTGVFLMLRRSRRCCTVQQHRRNLWRYPTLAAVTFAVAFVLLQYIVPGLAYRWQGQATTRQARTPLTADQQYAEKPAPARLAVAALQIDGMT